jgi:hypothetical protein
MALSAENSFDTLIDILRAKRIHGVIETHIEFSLFRYDKNCLEVISLP